MKIMELFSVVFALVLVIFNCNIKLSTSMKNDNLESKKFISLSPKAIDQRPCSCAMTTSCSCCEIVTILYTRDERRLCFNVFYSRNGLNVDLSLDTTIIKSMAIANYRPFRMCASVPGLLLSSICVNVSDLNQLANSIVVCPRLEISTKIQRWQISYVCQNISTTLPTGLLIAPGASTMQVTMMPGMMMMPSARPSAAGPPVKPGIMTAPRPLALGATVPAVTKVMIMAMKPASDPSLPPGAMPVAGTPAAFFAQQSPTGPNPQGATPLMQSAGTIVPRPADGLLYSLEPLFRLQLSDPSNNFTALPDSKLLSLQTDHFEQRSSNNNDTDFVISDSEKEVKFNETIGYKIPTMQEEPMTSSEQIKSTRILKRSKRQYDIFDIFQRSNRCDRAYRICITRSNNYIISRLKTTRFTDNFNKDMECNRKPTKVVHTSGENLCSYLTSTIGNDSESSFSSSVSSSSNNDSLDAIIVHDDSDGDSTFFSQNYPQIASDAPYNRRPRVYPARTPQQIISELQEQLKNLTNDAIKISHL